MKDGFGFVVVDMETGMRLCRYSPKDGYKLSMSLLDAQVYTNMSSARHAVLKASEAFGGKDLRVCRLIDGFRFVAGIKRGAKSRPMFIFNERERVDFDSVQSCANSLGTTDIRIYEAIRQGSPLKVKGSTYYADYSMETI